MAINAVVGASAVYVTGRDWVGASNKMLKRCASTAVAARTGEMCLRLPALSDCSRTRDANSSEACSREPRPHCWRKRSTCDRCGCSPSGTPDRCRGRRPGHREQTSLHLPHSPKSFLVEERSKSRQIDLIRAVRGRVFQYDGVRTN